MYLYVEQAIASSLEKPYRRRVYHVTGPEDGLSAVGVHVQRRLARRERLAKGRAPRRAHAGLSRTEGRLRRTTALER